MKAKNKLKVTPRNETSMKVFVPTPAGERTAGADERTGDRQIEMVLLKSLKKSEVQPAEKIAK